jgi:hypothetical protein
MEEMVDSRTGAENVQNEPGSSCWTWSQVIDQITSIVSKGHKKPLEWAPTNRTQAHLFVNKNNDYNGWKHFPYVFKSTTHNDIF